MFGALLGTLYYMVKESEHDEIPWEVLKLDIDETTKVGTVVIKTEKGEQSFVWNEDLAMWLPKE